MSEIVQEPPVARSRTDGHRIEVFDEDGRPRLLSVGEALDIAMDIHRYRRDVETAAKLYGAVLAIEPDNPRALQFFGILLDQCGEGEKAVAHLKRAAALSPNDAGCHNNLGNILFNNDDPDGAQAAYRTAITIDPAFAQPYSNLGTILDILGEEKDEAERLLRKAVELEPNFFHAWFRLSAHLLSVGRQEEALEANIHALNLAPRKLSNNVLLANVYFRLGRYDKARELLEDWAEAEPDNPVPLHHLEAYKEKVPERCSDGYVATTFNRFAKTFESRLKSLDYRAPDLVATKMVQLDGEPEGTLSILDAGCGTGWCGPDLRPFARDLVGVDLAPAMLAHAERAGHYDELVEGELTEYIEAQPGRFDRIVVCDTLCYFGDLAAVTAAAFAALKPGGRVIATFEKMADVFDSPTFHLQHNGRYQHTAAYIADAFRAAGFTVRSLDEEDLRKEWGHFVPGFLLTAERPADA